VRKHLSFARYHKPSLQRASTSNTVPTSPDSAAACPRQDLTGLSGVEKERLFSQFDAWRRAGADLRREEERPTENPPGMLAGKSVAGTSLEFPASDEKSFVCNRM
jgi:hypothetical protein